MSADVERGNLELLSLKIWVGLTGKKTNLALPVHEKESDKKSSGTNPPKRLKKIPKWVLFKVWFNTYRRFFVFTLGINLIGLSFAAFGNRDYGIKPGAFVTANFNVAVLMRNEIFQRIIYLMVNTLFAKWTPLWWRLGCTSVLQHLGGIHSGCAVSGLLWLLFETVKDFMDKEIHHDAVLVMGTVTLAIIGLSALSAFPWIRNNHHNVFERHHRFLGWLGVFSTWGFMLLSDMWNTETHTWNMSFIHLIRQQDFWFTLGMTILVALPWCFVRKVPVDIELPSSKVAIIRFQRGMQQGLLGRISRSPVWEYHAFGIISEGKNAKHHYLIAGVQGDFTTGLVENPPKALWTRELKFPGVSNTSTLYKRGIRVCTGTGIGAALSTCLQSPDWYLIWIGSDQERTFGPTISGLIHKHIEPERLLLWDSKKRGGRPELMKLIKEVYYAWGAEVVFITSNYVGNFEMLHGCEDAGIPAFGTLWDF